MTAVLELPRLRGEGRPLTPHDLLELPDDGRRYELVDGSLLVDPGPSWDEYEALREEYDGYRYELLDGMLLVSPAPRFKHQVALLELSVLLHGAAPADLQVLFAPFDVRLALDTNLQPDALVAPKTAFTEANLPVAPLLAVEVLSPSTRRFDLALKRERYQRAGTASYWVVDPLVPSLVAWELRDGEYAEVARVSGDEAFDATLPFPVRIVPSALVPE